MTSTIKRQSKRLFMKSIDTLEKEVDSIIGQALYNSTTKSFVRPKYSMDNMRKMLSEVKVINEIDKLTIDAFQYIYRMTLLLDRIVYVRCCTPYKEKFTPLFNNVKDAIREYTTIFYTNEKKSLSVNLVSNEVIEFDKKFKSIVYERMNIWSGFGVNMDDSKFEKNV